MATFVVTTLNDLGADGFARGTLEEESADGDGLSLNEAISLSNDLEGVDTIFIDRAIAGDIMRPSFITVITDAVILEGNGLTISGDVRGDDVTLPGTAITDIDASGDLISNNSRLFRIEGDTSDTTFSNFTLSGGENRAVGGSTIASGGAIRSDSPLTIINSRLSGNFAEGGGGGIFGADSVTVVNSVIDGNRASNLLAEGGGINGRTVSIINSTVANNETAGTLADGGGVSALYELYVNNSTITNNRVNSDNSSGGGVASLGVNGTGVTLINSIVSGNLSSLNGADDIGGFGQNASATVYQGGNIVGTQVLDGAEVVGTVSPAEVFVATDPVLGGGALLQNPNGTVSAQILSTGPAVAAGDASLLPADTFDLDSDGDQTEALPIDAAGAPRLNAGTLSLGAVESRFEVPSLEVTTLLDLVDAEDGETSLREAVAFANSNGRADDTITFADGVSGVLRLTQGEIEVLGDMVINGGGLVTISGDANGDDITLDGTDITDVRASGAGRLDDNSRIFLTSSFFTDLEIEGLTFTGGHTSASGFENRGGVIRSDGTLTIRNSDFRGNGTSGDGSSGGAVFSSSDLIVENSQFFGNHTFGDTADGGAVVALTRMNVTSSEFVGNTTHGLRSEGGALYTRASSGFGEISESRFAGNATYGVQADGGAIGAYRSLSVINTEVTGNTTAGRFAEGGGISSGDGRLTITGSILSHNLTTGYYASGAGANAENLVVTNTVVHNNATTGTFGTGAGLNSNENLTITNSVIAQNTSSGSRGEGAALVVGESLVVHSSIIMGNSASADDTYAGGIGVSSLSGSQPRLYNSILLGNVNGRSAPAESNVFVFGGSVNLTSSGRNIVGTELLDGRRVRESGITADDVFASVTQTLIDTDGDGIAETASGFQTGELELLVGGGITASLSPDGVAIDAGNRTDLPEDTQDLDGDGDTNEVLPLDAIGNARVVDELDLGPVELQSPTINGTDLGDTLSGTDAGDTINALAGDDGISALGGADLIFGGQGGDSIAGGDGADSIFGDAGDDFLSGEAGSDSVDGGAGNDTLLAGPGGDVLTGADGDDLFIIDRSSGATAITDFQPGQDVLRIDGFRSGVRDLQITDTTDGAVVMLSGSPSVQITLLGLSADQIPERGIEYIAGSPIETSEIRVDGATSLRDILRGSATESETFVMQDDGVRDVVRDFDVGTDVIDVSAFAASFSDLTITNILNRGGDTYWISIADRTDESELIVRFAAGQVMDAAALTADSFVFADQPFEDSVVVRDAPGLQDVSGTRAEETFVMLDDGVRDVVRNFDVGTDQVDVSAFAASLADLAITNIVNRGGDTYWISIADRTDESELIVRFAAGQEMDAAQLTEDSFIFG